MLIPINNGNERSFTTITECRSFVRATITGASMYPRTVALAPATPTLLGFDVVKASIGRGC